LCAALALAAGACDKGTGGGGGDYPSNGFKEIYEEAAGRVGVKIIDTPAIPAYADGPPDGAFTEDNTMGQLANCQYVCNAINAKWGLNIQPGAGTALWAANMEYTLKVVDLANKKLGITTNYGTGSYATKQAADTIAVDQCVSTLIKSSKLFVAVASDTTKAAHSTDGINWSAATLPNGAYWASVTYGNGKFEAVANYTVAGYSTNGVNWSAATLPAANYWQAVTYGNGKFVAVARHTNKAAYSTDGVNWSAATLPAAANWYSVCYGES
jgi:hypothetical protein